MIGGNNIFTPLMCAIAQQDIDRIKDLCMFADLNATHCGQNGLVFAARCNNVEILRISCMHGADLHIYENKTHCTALHVANIHKENIEKYSPLILATQQGYFHAVERLLLENRRTHIPTNDQEFSFLLIVHNDFIDITQLLLGHGVDVLCTDGKGNNAITLARETEIKTC